jgi:hypothetical protein
MEMEEKRERESFSENVGREKMKAREELVFSIYI